MDIKKAYNWWAGGANYSTEFQTWLDRLTTLGYTQPSNQQKGFLDTLFRGLKTDANFALLDIAYMFYNNGSKQTAKVNIKTPASYEIAADIGTVTWASNTGMKGDGTTGALDTTWNPSINGVNFLQNSNSFGVWVTEAAIQGSKCAIGATLLDSSNQGIMLNPRNVTDVYRTQDNNAVTTSTAGATSAVGLTSVVRVSSTEYRIYKNGIDVSGAILQTSNAIVNLKLFICAQSKNSNVAASFYGNNIAFAYAGGGGIDQLKLYNRLNTFFLS